MLEKLLTLLTEKRVTEPAWASIRLIDDYSLEVTYKPAIGKTVSFETCLLDVDDAALDLLDRIADNTDFETHKYSEWQESRYQAFSGYEVAVVEHCYKCQPMQNDEPAPRPMYISWMDNPLYYRCAGGF